VPLLYDDLVCRDAVELASDYLEGALPRRQRRSYERHIRGCPNCAAHLGQIRAMIAALGTAAPEELSEDAQQDLIDVFHRFRGEQDRADGQ
jgi:anti-sigma factor RsiW